MLTLILYLTIRDFKKLYEELYDLYDNLLQRFRFLQDRVYYIKSYSDFSRNSVTVYTVYKVPIEVYNVEFV